MSRNGGYDRYRATLADDSAWARARRPKYCKLANNRRLRQAVAGKLRLDWSPEQIAGWLKRTHPEDECNQVSHETIYRSLFVQTRGALKKELLGHLRSKRTMLGAYEAQVLRGRRGHWLARGGRGVAQDRRTLRHRSARARAAGRLINATSMLVTSHIDVYEDHLAIRLKSADDGKISDSTDEAALPICRRPKQRIWRITQQARPRSADRAQSPVAISQNGNISKNRRRLLKIWAVNCQIGSLETAC